MKKIDAVLLDAGGDVAQSDFFEFRAAKVLFKVTCASAASAEALLKVTCASPVSAEASLEVTCTSRASAEALL